MIKLTKNLLFILLEYKNLFSKIIDSILCLTKLCLKRLFSKLTFLDFSSIKPQIFIGILNLLSQISDRLLKIDFVFFKICRFRGQIVQLPVGIASKKART